MIPAPCCNPLVCKQLHLSRTVACPLRAIADAILTRSETGCRRLRICRRDTRRDPARWRTRVKTGTSREVRLPLRPRQARWQSHAQPCEQARQRKLFVAPVFVRESGSTVRERLKLRRAAIRNVQSVDATNAHPFRQPAFLPGPHSEFAASCEVRFPSEDKNPQYSERFRANVYHPASI